MGGLKMDVLKVSTKSNPNSVAGALAGVLRENGKAEIQAIGAGALNQAVKAIAIARGFVAPHGMDSSVFLPSSILLSMGKNARQSNCSLSRADVEGTVGPWKPSF